MVRCGFDESVVPQVLADLCLLRLVRLGGTMTAELHIVPVYFAQKWYALRRLVDYCAALSPAIVIC